MTDMVFTRNLNFLRKTLTDQKIIQRYLTEFTDDELYHMQQNMSNLLSRLIKGRKSKHEKLISIKNKLIDKLKKEGMTNDEIENFITELVITDIDNTKDVVENRRKFNKNNKFPVKYKSVTTDKNGNQKVYSWTGVGRRPKFFKDLSDEQLEKYNISPGQKNKLPIMYRAVEIKNGKEIVHTWSGVGNRSSFFSNLTPKELEQYKVI
ncbi:hypothetical protein [Photorhabdus hainanensis]|uniref:hypothetical protein n=1 Tax=Photorhabdus hainanensis TaxID=1004166 RepID=UPI001BD48557|nr:hypothetical protein [Photorhabdus hainanensis]MBS9434859.1 hypothetical protein [Photorhabdus hainanensis]